MIKSKLFSISVLCHNQLLYTKKCIESVLSANSKCKYELIITDNASTDGTLKYLESLKQSNVNVRLIKNKTNKGFIEGNQDALQLAKGKYFLLLNNDTEVSNNWLDKISEAFESESNIKIVGPQGAVIKPDGIGYATNDDNYEYIEGCCLTIPTKFAKEIKLFHPKLEFAYCEDADLNFRVRAMGYEIKRVSFLFKHYHAQTTNNTNDTDIKGYWLKNHYLFHNQHGKYIRTKSFEKKIVIQRMGAIGDVLLATPIIEAIKKRNKFTKIIFVTNCPGILANNPNIDEIRCVTPAIGKDDLFVDLDMSYENDLSKHYVDSYLECFNKALNKPDIPLELKSRTPEHYLSDEDEKWVDSQGLKDKKYIVFHAGITGWKGKNLPVHTFNEVIRCVREKGYDAIEVGHQKNLDNVSYHPHSLNRSAVIIKYATAFIGIDSAPLHIAQAYRKKGVAFFGCTNPKFILTQNELLIKPVMANVGCIHCHHWRKTPRTFTDCLRETTECMLRITPEQILNSLESALN